MNTGLLATSLIEITSKVRENLIQIINWDFSSKKISLNKLPNSPLPLTLNLKLHNPNQGEKLIKNNSIQQH